MSYQHSIHCDCAECDEALHYSQMYWFIENSKPQGINMGLPSTFELERSMAIVQEARNPYKMASFGPDYNPMYDPQIDLPF